MRAANLRARGVGFAPALTQTRATALAWVQRWAGAKQYRKGPKAQVLAIAAAMAIVAIFIVETATPDYVTISSLDLLPLLVAGWLLSGRATAALTALAICGQLALGVLGEIHWFTAAAYVVASLAAAAAAHVGASNSAGARESRERELSLLLETTKKISSVGSVKEVMAQVVLAAASFVSQGPLGVKARATLFRTGAETATVVAEHDDLGISLKGREYAVPVDFLSAIDTGPRVLEVAEMPPSLGGAYAKAGVTSVAVAGVRVGGERYGFLAASSRDERRAGAGELRLLKGLADVAGLALSQADRLTYERSRARLYGALFDLSLATADATEPHAVAEAVLKQARAVAEADVAMVAFEDGGLLRPLAMHPRGAAMAAAFDLKRGVVGQAYDGHQPVVANNRRSWSEPNDRAILPRGGSLAAVPLQAGKQRVGVLAVGARRHSFHPEQLEALRVLASQLGPAIDAAALRSSLVSSEARFRSLYAGLACGVVIHDMSGNLIDANWAALELMGVSRNSIERKGFLGPHWSVRLPGGSDLPVPNRPPAAVLTFHKPVHNLVAEVTPPRGSARWLRIDSRELQHGDEAAWVVTSFFEVPQP
jgi:GAF domain-containing protein